MASTDEKKLRNILRRMAERLDRMLRYCQEISGGYEIEDLRQDISKLRELVDVLDTRIHRLSLDDLDALRDGIAQVYAQYWPEAQPRSALWRRPQISPIGHTGRLWLSKKPDRGTSNRHQSAESSRT